MNDPQVPDGSFNHTPPPPSDYTPPSPFSDYLPLPSPRGIKIVAQNSDAEDDLDAAQGMNDPQVPDGSSDYTLPPLSDYTPPPPSNNTPPSPFSDYLPPPSPGGVDEIAAQNSDAEDDLNAAPGMNDPPDGSSITHAYHSKLDGKVYFFLGMHRH
jgi:hypothetical protein